jgi:DNA-binding Lrp family transcriptional regulator
MSKSKPDHAVALLLAQTLEAATNSAADDEPDDRYDPTSDHTFGKTAANDYVNKFKRLGIFQSNFPNYEAMGFRHQAFVDVVLDHQTGQEKSHAVSLRIQEDIDGVIGVYTIFGSVDLRCKVVGWTLRDVERASLEIRSLEGVISATTSITLDETKQNVISKKMAKFMRDPEFGKQLSQFIVAQKEP